MDIDGQIANSRTEEMKIATELANQEADAAAAILVLRHAFTEFREALVRHGVMPLRIVSLERERTPFLNQVFTNATDRMKATPHARGWRFHGSILAEDGSLVQLPFAHRGVGVGLSVIPQGDNAENFRRQGRDALKRAGLGSDFSSDHLYVEHIGPFVTVDWSRVTATPRPSGDITVRIQDEYVFRGGDLFIKLLDPESDGATALVPLVEEIARFISAGGR
jgi:hypothetical protein